MIRILLATAAAMVAVPAPAGAVLVYQRRPVDGNHRPPIVAARNDGTDSRVIGYGAVAQVSPSGHKVAYVHGDRLFVVGNRGRRRRLLVGSVFDPGVFLPYAWSPDDRYLAVGAEPTGAWLVDVRHRTKTHIPAGGTFTGASFKPDGSMFAFGAGTPQGEPLKAVELASLSRRSLGEGVAPRWGKHGVAFLHDRRLMLRKHVGEDPETLLTRNAYPRDWSADGNRLLAYEYSSLARQPVLIDLSPRRVKRLHGFFPYQLSRDGREILGEAGARSSQPYGNVVVRQPDGTLEVLATNAARASWTK